MIPRGFAILGASLLTLSFLPAASAQTPRQLATGNFTLSGESLRGVQGRSISQDFPVGRSPRPLVSSTGSNTNTTSSPQADLAIEPLPRNWTVGDRVDVILDRSSGAVVETTPLLVQDAPATESPELRVQYQLLQEDQ
ncbi:hypothetical protein H6F90_24430 [Trichocoleus sp. FACHB-591]|uniref:hypothetical protein n=1 Tax=Trichocoleus sp. FACHB-591 TaxID=2692872 RepID=UPI001684C31F|nr:hypothetical protein [Trichocoleus sp. FACHB-591]MBD2098219.1 hypothetical protein [Trichocoleus sp. FACHB-591]